MAEDLHEQVRRYVGVTQPHDETVAHDVLGSSSVVRLADTVTRQGSPWYASVAMALAEQRCLAYAAALISRSPTTITLLDTASEGARDRFLGSMLAAKETCVAVAHGWGRHPGFRTCSLRSLGRTPPKGDVLFVDVADALASAELASILEAVLATRPLSLVLGRRGHSPLVPRNPLLDLVQRLAGGFSPTPPAPPIDSMTAWRLGDASGAIELIHRKKALIFCERQTLVETVTQVVASEADSGRRCVIRTSDYELAAVLRLNHLPTCSSDTNARPILVHSDTNFDQLPVFAYLFP